MSVIQLCRAANTWLTATVCVLASGTALCVYAGTDTKQPTVDSSNVATADPVIPVPNITPCKVQLLHGERFGEHGNNKRMDATPHLFAYRPPPHCKGPYAKVVLDVEFAVDPGIQYDRTGSIWVNGVNLFFGTTQEPTPKSGQSWRVERDLTDYSSLLRAPGQGVALINNFVDATHNSVIHVDAQLLFYPANNEYKAPKVPDIILPLGGALNAPINVQTAADEASHKVAFPRNTTRVYMDLFTQSQSRDEFWYLCLPEKYVQQTSPFAMKRGYIGAPKKPRTCSGGNFREAEVFIDRIPAGIAPVSPWIYTGGIDPLLWRPTPGVQTLSFLPYRLDLTPFAGLLSDGKVHTVSVKVLGANHYFAVAANLLVYEDPNSEQTQGAVTLNTLKDVTVEPAVTSSLYGESAHTNGNVRTVADKDYVIEGYVNTSSGRVRTRVTQTVKFADTQRFTTIGLRAHRKVTELVTSAKGASVSEGGGVPKQKLEREVTYVLTVDKLLRAATDGRKTTGIRLRQSFDNHTELWEAGRLLYRGSVLNTIDASNQVTATPSSTGGFGSFASNGQASSQYFVFSNSVGDCYRGEVWALNGNVTSSSKENCGTQPMNWFVRPDASPDNFGWDEGLRH